MQLDTNNLQAALNKGGLIILPRDQKILLSRPANSNFALSINSSIPITIEGNNCTMECIEDGVAAWLGILNIGNKVTTYSATCTANNKLINVGYDADANLYDSANLGWAYMGEGGPFQRFEIQAYNNSKIVTKANVSNKYKFVKVVPNSRIITNYSTDGTNSYLTVSGSIPVFARGTRLWLLYGMAIHNEVAAEIVEVVSVSGNVIRLEAPILQQIDLTQAAISLTPAVTNVIINNVNFGNTLVGGPGQYKPSPVFSKFVGYVTFNNCTDYPSNDSIAKTGFQSVNSHRLIGNSCKFYNGIDFNSPVECILNDSLTTAVTIEEKGSFNTFNNISFISDRNGWRENVAIQIDASSSNNNYNNCIFNEAAQSIVIRGYNNTVTGKQTYVKGNTIIFDLGSNNKVTIL